MDSFSSAISARLIKWNSSRVPLELNLDKMLAKIRIFGAGFCCHLLSHYIQLRWYVNAKDEGEPKVIGTKNNKNFKEEKHQHQHQINCESHQTNFWDDENENGHNNIQYIYTKNGKRFVWVCVVNVFFNFIQKLIRTSHLLALAHSLRVAFVSFFFLLFWNLFNEWQVTCLCEMRFWQFDKRWVGNLAVTFVVLGNSDGDKNIDIEVFWPVESFDTPCSTRLSVRFYFITWFIIH